MFGVVLSSAFHILNVMGYHQQQQKENKYFKFKLI